MLTALPRCLVEGQAGPAARRGGSGSGCIVVFASQERRRRDEDAVIGRGNVGVTLGASGPPPATTSSMASVQPASPDGAHRRRGRRGSGRRARDPRCGRQGVVASLAGALAGKVVIDATNDVQGSGKLNALVELADGARPVRAFNTIGWENFADPVFDGVTADLFYAAEAGEAQEVAERLIGDIGLSRVARRGRDVRSRRLADAPLVHARLPAQARPAARFQAAHRRLTAPSGPVGRDRTGRWSAGPAPVSGSGSRAETPRLVAAGSRATPRERATQTSRRLSRIAAIAVISAV